MASFICRDIFSDRYQIIEKIGFGTFADVSSCRNKKTGELFAVKQLVRRFDGWEDVEIFPEVKALLEIPEHPNLLRMVELHFDKSIRCLSLVLDLMDTDLAKIIKDRKRLFPTKDVQSIMRQILKGLNHLHYNKFFHRDVKPENIMVNMRNKEYVVVLGDFGAMISTEALHPYREYVSTRWYRAPECILTAGFYGPKMDIWAAGCIFYEILTLAPLFIGASEADQIDKINDVLGVPSAEVLQKFFKVKSRNFSWRQSGSTSKLNSILKDKNFATRDFLRLMIDFDPDNRASAAGLLEHEYLQPPSDRNHSILATVMRVMAETGGGTGQSMPDDKSGPIPSFQLLTGNDNLYRRGNLGNRILIRVQPSFPKTITTEASAVQISKHEEDSSYDWIAIRSPEFQESVPSVPELIHPIIKDEHGSTSQFATTSKILNAPNETTVQPTTPMRFPRKKNLTFRDHLPVSTQIAWLGAQIKEAQIPPKHLPYRTYVDQLSQMTSVQLDSPFDSNFLQSQFFELQKQSFGVPLPDAEESITMLPRRPDAQESKIVLPPFPPETIPIPVPVPPPKVLKPALKIRGQNKGKVGFIRKKTVTFQDVASICRIAARESKTVITTHITPEELRNAMKSHPVVEKLDKRNKTVSKSRKDLSVKENPGAGVQGSSKSSHMAWRVSKDPKSSKTVITVVKPKSIASFNRDTNGRDLKEEEASSSRAPPFVGTSQKEGQTSSPKKFRGSSVGLVFRKYYAPPSKKQE